MDGPKQVITPGVLNVTVEPHEGPQETSFYLPQSVPGGVKVTMFGGWSKVDALAAQILIGLSPGPTQHEIGFAPDAVAWARKLAAAIVDALAPEPAAVPEPKPLILAAGESC